MHNCKGGRIEATRTYGGEEEEEDIWGKRR